MQEGKRPVEQMLEVHLKCRRMVQLKNNNPRFLTLGGMFVEGVCISCGLSCQCLCVLATDTHWTLTGTLSEEARPPRVRKTDRFCSLHKTLLKSIVKNSCSLIGKREGQRSTITMLAESQPMYINPRTPIESKRSHICCFGQNMLGCDGMPGV